MKTIDEMIAVMQAAKDGKKVVECQRISGGDWVKTHNPVWNWYDYDYRIAPEPLHGWVNIYHVHVEAELPQCRNIWPSREDADFKAKAIGGRRIACVEMVEASRVEFSGKDGQ